MAKNSFVIYHEYYESLVDLTDEQIGKLFRAIFDYEINKKMPYFNGELKIAFRFIKTDLDNNSSKYEERCEKNRENGKRGGRPKKQENPKNPNGFSKTQKTQMVFQKPKKADNDNDSDNDIKENKEDVIEEKKKEKPIITTTTTTTITKLDFLKLLFKDLVSDCDIREDFDTKSFDKAIKESRFLKGMQRVTVSWLNKNYEKILSGYYKDFPYPRDKKPENMREYDSHDLEGLFDDLNDIEV